MGGGYLCYISQQNIQEIIVRVHKNNLSIDPFCKH